jgi:RNA ligase (TIGR02306 family)
MSEFKVAYTKVVAINPHPNPEVHSLHVATIYGFQVIIRKDSLNVGDLVLFAPVDSILPTDLEAILFPEGSKIKLNNSRIRQIRIQRFPSQGMLLNMSDVQKHLTNKGYKNFLFEEEKDYAAVLGITKYEPPVAAVFTGTKITSKRRLAEHPQFHTYNGIDNIKWGDPFNEDENVSIQLKLHGTNARLGNLKKTPKTLWEKFLKLVHLLPEYEVRYGSNNVDITAKNGAVGFYATDIYGEAFKKCDAANKVKPNEVIYGEIIGEGIQKGYHYGHKTPHFVLFDVKVFNEDGSCRWLSPIEVQMFAEERGFEMVPTLFEGKYDRNIANTLSVGADPYYPQHKVREGIVIKSEDNYNDPMSSSSKKVRKIINPAYLDDTSNTDNH